jgi:hypothetical protein
MLPALFPSIVRSRAVWPVPLVSTGSGETEEMRAETRSVGGASVPGSEISDEAQPPEFASTRNYRYLFNLATATANDFTPARAARSPGYSGTPS